MNEHMLIPLLATIVYLVPLVLLLLHRPWPKQGVLFLLYLIPAMLYSLADFLLRAGSLAINDELLVKIIICLAILMIVQFHYILRSYATNRIDRTSALGYVAFGAIIIFTALDYVPRNLEVTDDGVSVQYGLWLLPLVVFVLALILQDLYLLRRRFRASTQTQERNQLLYLVVATFVGAIFLLSSLTPNGTEYATGHIGNLAVALIIVYAIVAHRLMDVGAAIRQALVYFWLAVITGLAYGSLFWLASIIFDFEWTYKTILSTLAVAAACVVLLFFMYSLLQKTVGEIFVGRKYRYRQNLTEFISSTYGITDLEAFGNQLLSLTCRSTDSQQAWLLVPSFDKGGFETRSTCSLNKNQTPEHLRISQDSPILTWLEREATPLSARDIQILPEFSSLWDEERRQLTSAKADTFFPIINQGKLIALLVLGTKRRGGPLALEELDLILSAVKRFAGAIHKESLREELQVKEEELRIFNRLMTILSSSINIGEAFDRFSEELQKVAPVDWATIAMADGENLCFLALSSTTPSPWKVNESIPIAGTGAELVMREQSSFYEPDLVKQQRFSTGDKHAKQGIRSVVYLPLISGGKSIGALIIASRSPRAYTIRQVKLLEQLASYITAPIENSQLYNQAREKARIDELTGLFNRRHFDERLKEEITRHARYGGTFSLLMLDLDSFKVYNDIFGHPAGDDLLREVGDLIKHSIRTSDQAFRYGGDEFAIILPHIDVEGAYHVAERVRQSIAHRMQESSTGVTSSLGLANCPANGVTPADLVTVADTALYYAKYNGGNRTHLPTKVLSLPVSDTNRETRSPSLAAIYALTTAVDAKDHYTYMHSHQVRGYALALAEATASPSDVISRLSAASLLHDIGKIGVHDQTLNAKGPLTPAQMEELKTHPRLGVTIIGNVPGLAPCVPAILYHHENYDGSGYPEGLKGEAIPLEARILSIANAFADMTSERPHRAALSWEEALEEIGRHAGTQFDPTLAQAFIEAVRSGTIARPARADTSDEAYVPVTNATAPQEGDHGTHSQ
ncbi:MAG: hypothetical protein A2Y72_04945 [Chloroflexi bacterium RBG_13_53_26]|nr:MAG: hypothetical protein A2Y72_04945 [Chloroflexi bacterium RBG_13_53_26]